MGFFSHEDKAILAFSKFGKRVQNEKGCLIFKIRSDHDGEFDNLAFKNLYVENGFKHEFSTLRIPQQIGDVERKNRYLQEMRRTMLNEYSQTQYFRVKTINTSCYVSNQVFL
jgi:transposase InsO family protein